MIEGFLDISLPPEDTEEPSRNRPNTQPSATSARLADRILNPGLRRSRSPSGHKFVYPQPFRSRSPKPLFNVKAGGIAGYLCKSCCQPLIRLRTQKPLASLCNTPSYVDIKARTDTYVGFLPSHALERLLEKRPIVQLTLAKRLISLLSPLSMYL